MPSHVNRYDLASILYQYHQGIQKLKANRGDDEKAHRGNAGRVVVGRKIKIRSVMQLSGRRDAALRTLASLTLCRSGDPALSEPVRKGPAGLSTDAGAID
jgi:hypothetical protein